MIRCNICGDTFATGKALKLHKHIHDSQSVKEIANDLKWLDAKNKVFKEVILESKAKCEYGDCEHSLEDHEAGVCWHITDEKLRDEPNEKKFCGCKSTPELVHGWDILKVRNPINGEGWQDPGKKINIKRDPITKKILKVDIKYDCIIITKVCHTCRNIRCIRVDKDDCSDCLSKTKGLLV